MSAGYHKSIPQVPEASVSAKLLQKVRRASLNGRSRKESTSRSESARSDEIGSENSQVLYMQTSKPLNRASRGSLSSISNKSVGSKNIVTDSTSTSLKVHRGLNDIAWKVIDREIFEWQYVCRTGRPYWWSPESKYLRLKEIQQQSFHAANSEVWMKGWHDRTMPDYETTRRAISDSYLSDPGTVGDVAHLIAVQLLSACFTIPPDLTDMPTPNYMTFGKADFPDLSNYRMISSLRMHTHFRYSPALGHQPRNTSPVEAWPRNYEAYDGTAHNPELSEVGAKSSEAARLRKKSRRRTVHRSRNVSDGSCSSSSCDGRGDDRILRRSSSVDGSGNFTTDAHFTGRRARRRRATRRQMPSLNDDEEMAINETTRGYHMPPPSTSTHSLTSLLRSEPHPVSIQPVKELVVKGWNGIRRHLRASLPSASSRDTKPADATLSTSDPVPDFREVFNIGNDGRERRRRARERGDILSSSTEGVPHYNTPASVRTPGSDSSLSGLTSDSISPARDNGETRPKVFDAFYTSTLSRYLSTGDLTLTSRPEPERHISTQSAPGGEVSSESRTESGYFVPQRAKTAASFKPRNQRSNRRSLLSEVCTPDDFEGTRTTVSSPGPTTGGNRETVLRSVLSTIGSDISILDDVPRVFIKLPSPKEKTSTEVQKLNSSSSSDDDDASSDDERRPGITRANTSGTQIFTPKEESFEADGIPKGPSKKEWEQPRDTKGKQRERSFL